MTLLFQYQINIKYISVSFYTHVYLLNQILSQFPQELHQPNSIQPSFMKIIIGVYFVIQILMLSAFMVLQLKLFVHSILMACSCFLYIVVSFKSPGHFKKQKKELCISDQIQYEKQKVSFNQKENTNPIKPIIQQNQLNQNETSLDKRQQDKNKENVQIQCAQVLQNLQNLQQKLENKSIQHKLEQKLEKKEVQSKRQNKRSKKQLNQGNYAIQTILKDKNINKQSRQRYCRICQIYQPMRVRHCHQCQTCICTFDHHCPWMDNCIGQKNRHIFLVYLLVQSIQFLCALIIVFRGISQNLYLQNVYFFAIGLLLITFLSFSLLLFHCYLMIINFTTWQFVRWKKIEYLNIVCEQVKISPFSMGIYQNCINYFKIGFDNERKQWEEDYLQNKQEKKQKSTSIKNNKKANLSIRQKAQTQRVISKFVKQID